MLTAYPGRASDLTCDEGSLTLTAAKVSVVTAGGTAVITDQDAARVGASHVWAYAWTPSASQKSGFYRVYWRWYTGSTPTEIDVPEQYQPATVEVLHPQEHAVIVTPQYMKETFLAAIPTRFLRANDICDEIVNYGNHEIERHLRRASARLALDIKTSLRPTTVTRERHDYLTGQWSSPTFTLPSVQPSWRPIRSVEGIRLRFGNVEQVLEIPGQWVVLDKSTSQSERYSDPNTNDYGMSRTSIVSMVPTSSSPAGLLLYTFLFQGFKMPFFSLAIRNNIPCFMEIDYTYGLDFDAAGSQMQEEMMFGVCELAMASLLPVLYDQWRLGSKSIGADGLNQSWSFKGQGYKDLMQQFKDDYDGWLPAFLRSFGQTLNYGVG